MMIIDSDGKFSLFIIPDNVIKGRGYLYK